MSEARMAWGRGLATIAADGSVLDTWYPDLGLGEFDPSAALVDRETANRHDTVRGVEVRVVETSIDLDAAPESASDMYLRLHLLSNRLCAPRTINLDNAFGLLTTISSLGCSPIDVP